MTKEEISDLQSLMARKEQTLIEFHEAELAVKEAQRQIDGFFWKIQQAGQPEQKKPRKPRSDKGSKRGAEQVIESGRTDRT